VSADPFRLLPSIVIVKGSRCEYCVFVPKENPIGMMGSLDNVKYKPVFVPHVIDSLDTLLLQVP